MPVEVNWDNDAQTVMRYDLRGKWTWEEYYVALNRGVEMRRSVTHTVDVIANLTDSVRLPGSVLTHMRRLSEDRENRGLMVIVGGGSFVIAMIRIYSTLVKSAQQYVRAVNTLAEARQLLASETRQGPST